MNAVGELSCENCGVGYGTDDIFCENCGYDFITGSLPSGDEGLTPPVPAGAPDIGEESEARSAPTLESPLVAESPAAPVEASGPASTAPVVKLQISVAVDRNYFDAVVSDGELEFPDNPMADTNMEVSGNEFHVGRASQSRAIHPDLDIAQLSGDPAVSSRHAVIRVLEDGSLTVTDVGSTNGTFVGTVDSKPIVVGEPHSIVDETPVFVGAWTRLVISPVEG